MKVEINGVAVNVVSQEEAEQVPRMACCRVGSPGDLQSPWDDNLTGSCSICGHAIIFRPTSPTKPAKVCIECVVEFSRATKQ